MIEFAVYILLNNLNGTLIQKCMILKKNYRRTTKNIYLGETRNVMKLNSGNEPSYQEEYYKQYYCHSGHLGSASLISD